MEENKKKKIVMTSTLLIAVLLLAIVGTTFAYFTAQTGIGKEVGANLQSGTTDNLTFKAGSPIVLEASLENFKKSGGNLSGTSTAQATLLANNTTNTATMDYNVYYIIDANNFVYTTEDEKAELVLKVTDPTGAEVTSITGLKKTDLGFDITNKTGTFLVAKNYEITGSPTKTDDWNIEVIFVNLDSNQNKNMGKTLSGKIYMTKEDVYAIPQIHNAIVTPTSTSINATLEIGGGTSTPTKYYYAIAESNAGVTSASATYQETTNPTYEYTNLDGSKEYTVFIYFLDDKNNKSTVYETTVTTKEYVLPVITNVTKTSDEQTTIALSVDATKGEAEISKYMFSKDNGVNYVESDSNTYTFVDLTPGTTYNIKVKVKDTNNKESTEFVVDFTTKESPAAIVNKTVKTCTHNFNTIATTNETENGLCSMEDDYGTSYYYRGAVNDNWVKFAGFYWRIIRINGNGSVRMIYSGSTAPTSAQSVVYTGTDNIGTSAFNTSYNDNAYVGYMYGTPGSSTYEATHANTNNSTIKTKIDAWYKTNIEDIGYGTKIADVVYCNDRSLSSGTGVGTTYTVYGAYNRLSPNKTPTLKCTQKNDAFTVSDTSKGNGKLTYPVGLLTADEVSIAGGLAGTVNSNYYLKSNNYYWAASADRYSSGNALVFDVISVGSLGFTSVAATGAGVRPVISLTADYFGGLKGSGTYNNPFTE